MMQYNPVLTTREQNTPQNLYQVLGLNAFNEKHYIGSFADDLNDIDI